MRQGGLYHSETVTMFREERYEMLHSGDATPRSMQCRLSAAPSYAYNSETSPIRHSDLSVDKVTTTTALHR